MPKPLTSNTLFYGDNLPILRDYSAFGTFKQAEKVKKKEGKKAGRTGDITRKRLSSLGWQSLILPLVSSNLRRIMIVEG